MKQYKRGITFGAFDPLHYGHIKIFERAKEQCEMLIVCVSTQDYIRMFKGREERVPFFERAKAVSQIRYVDVVYWQDQGIDATKEANVRRFQPDVIFVGSDWNPRTFKGEGLGVPVIYLPHTDGMSSTQLVDQSKIKHTVC